jgi:putative membrane protein
MSTRLNIPALLIGICLSVNPALSAVIPLATSQSATSDQQFIMTAAKDGLAETAMGHLAVQQSAGPAVKQFAQQMILDHTKANDELLTLALQQKIEPPKAMSDASQIEYDKLTTLKGAAFDQEYMRTMVNAHRRAVDLFQKEAQNGNDKPVQDWANKTLPMLQHHLQMAQQIQTQLKR